MSADHTRIGVLGTVFLFGSIAIARWTKGLWGIAATVSCALVGLVLLGIFVWLALNEEA